jgi:glycerol kinase
VWDRRTLHSPRPAIVWQDRRTTGICERLREGGVEPRVAGLTGLRLDPYFTGTKFAWLAEHEQRLWSGVRDGALALGTVDSYVVARLTGGAAHVTDPSNASRTLLFDLEKGAWSEELCELFDVPRSALPEVVPSSGVVGTTDPDSFLGLALPVAGIAGDQQAALFGQACYSPGDTKCTYGTGSFVLTNTGSTPVRSDAGLLSTVAWDIGDGLVYALEGSIFVTGAAVQWLRDGLGLIDSAAEIEGLARTVPDAGDVVFVPALTGLGAPHWDPHARGAIVGITRGTTRAHLARATLDAIRHTGIAGQEGAIGLTRFHNAAINSSKTVLWNAWTGWWAWSRRYRKSRKRWWCEVHCPPGWTVLSCGPGSTACRVSGSGPMAPSGTAGRVRRRSRRPTGPPAPRWPAPSSTARCGTRPCRTRTSVTPST